MLWSSCLCWANKFSFSLRPLAVCDYKTHITSIILSLPQPWQEGTQPAGNCNLEFIILEERKKDRSGGRQERGISHHWINKISFNVSVLRWLWWGLGSLEKHWLPCLPPSQLPLIDYMFRVVPSGHKFRNLQKSEYSCSRGISEVTWWVISQDVTLPWPLPHFRTPVIPPSGWQQSLKLPLQTRWFASFGIWSCWILSGVLCSFNSARIFLATCVPESK